eukprot:scaffold349651_cov41-Prasinocladus_malaysianus.AAC.1
MSDCAGIWEQLAGGSNSLNSISILNVALLCICSISSCVRSSSCNVRGGGSSAIQAVPFQIIDFHLQRCIGIRLTILQVFLGVVARSANLLCWPFARGHGDDEGGYVRRYY